MTAVDFEEATRRLVKVGRKILPLLSSSYTRHELLGALAYARPHGDEAVKAPARFPLVPGWYWAKWQIAADGTCEGDELTPSPEWEIVQVNANRTGWEDNPSDAEALSVSVCGVRETQWRDCFVWGEFVSPLRGYVGEQRC